MQPFPVVFFFDGTDQREAVVLKIFPDGRAAIAFKSDTNNGVIKIVALTSLVISDWDFVFPKTQEMRPYVRPYV